jgi:phage-related baseplate assembly protein
MIQFVAENPSAILSDLKLRYEQIAGRQLSDADPEMHVLSAIAYRLSLTHAAVNHTANQNLLRYATGAALEEIGYLFAVTRLSARGAGVTLQFTSDTAVTSRVIPAGTRVRSLNGAAIFETLFAITVPDAATAGAVSITQTVLAECTTPGAIGNGYEIGDVNTMVSPIAFVTDVRNTDESGGGVEEESDDELRERIALAPSRYSVAGPRDAYAFFAKSAHPGIVDVAVTNPVPGQVNLYPLMLGGQLPSSAVLAAVLATCNDDKVRPMNDTVVVEAPVAVPFAIVVGIELRKSADPLTTALRAQVGLEDWVGERRNKLGSDIVRSQLIAAASVPGMVYRATVLSPSSDIILQPHEVGVNTGVTVNITGISDE